MGAEVDEAAGCRRDQQPRVGPSLGLVSCIYLRQRISMSGEGGEGEMLSAEPDPGLESATLTA